MNIKGMFRTLSLRKKCPYSVFFCSVFSRIRTQYGNSICKFPYSIRMPENTDQENSEYGHFLLSASNIHEGAETAKSC